MRRLGFAFALALACCSGARGFHLDEATAIAGSGGLSLHRLHAGDLDIVSFERLNPASATLTVYIEGDGRAWTNPWQPSTDPTPTDPIGLRLAVADRVSPLIYLARPCQFEISPACDNRLWTSARYSPEVVDAYQHLLDDALRRTGSKRLGLIGYSGGGALAALLAERRRDVAWLVTVAADLDLSEWARLNDLAPLSGSLDPADSAAVISGLPQVHLTGADDRTVPAAVTEAFVHRLTSVNRARVVVEAGFDHACCWAAAWPQLLGQLGVDR